ncbi:hypothetical protein QG041_09635, partial [Kingella kingae]|uniref:hypothetical protein n=1 Tax=Kingella kingae TaxID=504 RepID=UPI00254A5296
FRCFFIAYFLQHTFQDTTPFSGAKSDFVSLLILSGVEWFWCCMVTVEPVVQWCDAHRDIVAKVHRYLSVFHR